MNYKRIYDSLMQRAVERVAEGCTPKGYTEKHHIVPKCIGGGNEQENIAVLTGREHFIAHWLLSNIYKGDKHHKLHYAFNMMASIRKDEHRVTSHAYVAARKRGVVVLSLNYTEDRKQKYRDRMRKESRFLNFPAIITESKKPNKFINCVWTFANDNNIRLQTIAKIFDGVGRITKGYGVFSIVDSDTRHPDPRHVKFKEQDVLDIKLELIKGSEIAPLAKKYNVSNACIERMKGYIDWDDFPKELKDAKKLRGTSILSEQDVRDIKLRLNNGEYYRDISKDYPVGHYCIHDIARGRSWKHIII